MSAGNPSNGAPSVGHKARKPVRDQAPERSVHVVRTFMLTMVGPLGWIFFRTVTYAFKYNNPTIAAFFEGMTKPFLFASPLFTALAIGGIIVCNKRKDPGLAALFGFSVMLNLILALLLVFPLLLPRLPGQ